MAYPRYDPYSRGVHVRRGQVNLQRPWSLDGSTLSGCPAKAEKGKKLNQILEIINLKNVNEINSSINS